MKNLRRAAPLVWLPALGLGLVAQTASTYQNVAADTSSGLLYATAVMDASMKSSPPCCPIATIRHTYTMSARIVSPGGRSDTGSLQQAYPASESVSLTAQATLPLLSTDQGQYDIYFSFQAICSYAGEFAAADQELYGFVGEADTNYELSNIPTNGVCPYIVDCPNGSTCGAQVKTGYWPEVNGYCYPYQLDHQLTFTFLGDLTCFPVGVSQGSTQPAPCT